MIGAHARTAPATAVAALSVAAGGLVALQLSRPGLLFGPTPDVSVYLGGAVRLVHGAVVFRDFVFVQPPGFVVLATPFGALARAIGTRDALAVLRLCTPLIAAATVFLACRLVRHRGLTAVVITGAVMACFPGELYALRGPQLEPVANLFLLIGAVLLFEHGALSRARHRQVTGGIALGLAVAVKLSAVVPAGALMLVAACVLRRHSARLAAGTFAGFGVVVAPFALLAPGAFWRDVVTTQLARVPAAGRAPLTERLGDITGVSGGGAARVASVLIAGGALLVVVIGALVRRRWSALHVFVLVATGVTALAQSVPSQYYPQYAALLAPTASVLLGLTAASIAESVRQRGRAITAAAVAVALAIGIGQTSHVVAESVVDVAPQVDALVPAGACTITNAPVYLVTSDRFQSTVPGCTVMTDPAGTVLALGSSSALAVATWRAAFDHVTAVVTDIPIDTWAIPAAAGIRTTVDADFTLHRAGGLYVYLRSRSRP